MTDLARIRILTLNIRKDNNLAYILQLADPQPHILLFQEVTLNQEGIDNIVAEVTRPHFQWVKVHWE